MIKAIIFDLNDVFINAPNITDRLHEKYGINAKKAWKALSAVLDQVRKRNPDSLFGLYKPFLEDNGVEISEKEFLKLWFSGQQVDEDMVDYGRSLQKRGLKVFCLSNNFKERVDHYKKNFKELLDLFDKTYFSWETGFVKPNMEAFKFILDDNNLKGEECIYFDDKKENIEGAEWVDMKATLFQGLEPTMAYIDRFVEPDAQPIKLSSLL